MPFTPGDDEISVYPPTNLLTGRNGGVQPPPPPKKKLKERVAALETLLKPATGAETPEELDAALKRAPKTASTVAQLAADWLLMAVLEKLWQMAQKEDKLFEVQLEPFLFNELNATYGSIPLAQAGQTIPTFVDEVLNSGMIPKPAGFDPENPLTFLTDLFEDNKYEGIEPGYDWTSGRLREIVQERIDSSGLVNKLRESFNLQNPEEDIISFAQTMLKFATNRDLTQMQNFAYYAIEEMANFIPFVVFIVVHLLICQGLKLTPLKVVRNFIASVIDQFLLLINVLVGGNLERVLKSKDDRTIAITFLGLLVILTQKLPSIPERIANLIPTQEKIIDLAISSMVIGIVNRQAAIRNEADFGPRASVADIQKMAARLHSLLIGAGPKTYTSFV